MNKVIYTKLFLKESGLPVGEATVKEYLPVWWQNTRNKEDSGLRLTDEGLDVVKKANISIYEIPYPQDMPITTQILIFLDKFIDCPYYITDKSITLTNDRKAVELSLFSGDIRKYGIAKAISRARQAEAREDFD
jgi:hypothetical protein